MPFPPAIITTFMSSVLWCIRDQNAPEYLLHTADGFHAYPASSSRYGWPDAGYFLYDILNGVFVIIMRVSFIFVLLLLRAFLTKYYYINSCLFVLCAA